MKPKLVFWKVNKLTNLWQDQIKKKKEKSKEVLRVLHYRQYRYFKNNLEYYKRLS